MADCISLHLRTIHRLPLSQTAHHAFRAISAQRCILALSWLPPRNGDGGQLGKYWMAVGGDLLAIIPIAPTPRFCGGLPAQIPLQHGRDDGHLHSAHGLQHCRVVLAVPATLHLPSSIRLRTGPPGLWQVSHVEQNNTRRPGRYLVLHRNHDWRILAQHITRLRQGGCRDLLALHRRSGHRRAALLLLVICEQAGEVHLLLGDLLALPRLHGGGDFLGILPRHLSTSRWLWMDMSSAEVVPRLRGKLY